MKAIKDDYSNKESSISESNKTITIPYSEWEKMQKEIVNLRQLLEKEQKEKEEIKNILEETLKAIDSLEESKKNMENDFEILKKQIKQKDEKIDQFNLKEKLKNKESVKENIKDNKDDINSNNKCSTTHTTNNDVKYQQFKNAFIDNYYNFFKLDGNKTAPNTRSRIKTSHSALANESKNENSNLCEPVPSFIKFLKKY